MAWKPEIMIKPEKIYIPSDKIIARFIDETLIIVPVETDTGTVDFDESLYSLEDTGREIWDRLGAKITVEKLCAELAEKYNAPLGTITLDVIELLEELLNKGLIVDYK